MIFEALLETRADRLVADALAIGRNEAAKLIKSGCVKANDRAVLKPSAILRIGDQIEILLPEKPAPIAAQAVDFDAEILYEDSELLVVNKPAGLVVHAAPSHKGATLVDWLKSRGFSLSTAGGEERHGIVHRIDKETTGALCVAKTDAAHRALAAQLQSREMGRYYLAIVDRALKCDCVVEKPIARHPKDRVKMAIVSGGRAAKSAFIKLANLSRGEELIAAKLFTGRTHQIRVHLQSLGAHIVGDLTYGYKPKKDEKTPLFLHAFRLYLKRPSTQKQLTVLAPLPDAFLSRLLESVDRDQINEILDEKHLNDRFANLLKTPQKYAR